MSKILKFNFATFDDVWDGLNDFLINNEKEIREEDYGGLYGTEMTAYNSVIHVNKAKLSDDWDFGTNLGYSDKKWSKLVTNYVDMNYLDLVKAEVNARELKDGKSYNHTVHFDNSHGSGKDCLISLTFQRRVGNPNPIVIYTTRASEVTKRLPFDLLLIQKMAEYVYGKKRHVEAMLFMPFIYINVENFLIWVAHHGGPKKVIKKQEDGTFTTFQNRVIKRYDDFMNTPLETIKYEVHKKAAAMVQKAKETKPLYAKDLELRLPTQTRKLNKRLQTTLNKNLLLD